MHDIELNPGPRSPKFPCGICHKAVTSNQCGVACDTCNIWHHTTCIHMSTNTYKSLHNISWHCTSCSIPQLTTSLPNSPTPINKSFSSHDIRTSPTNNRLVSQVTTTVQRQAHKPLKIININFQSIKNKIAELGNFISVSDPDILIGTETWLNQTITDNEIFPPGYSLLRKDRQDGYGGVLLAIKSDMIHEPIATPIQLEMTATKIHLNNNKHIIIAAIYRPPNSDLQYIDDMCNTIEDLTSRHKNSVLWVGGDLNLPDINWPDCTIQGHSYPVDINKRFLDMLLTTHTEQMITTPTRQNNILDIFITNRPSLTSQCHTIPGLGDHHAISIHSSAQARRAKPIRRKIHLWRHADIDKLKQDASTFTTSFTETFTINSSIHTMWDIKSNLTELHEQHIPSKFTTTRFHQPWITTEIKRITRRKQRAYNRCTNKPITSREHRKYKELQKQTKELCKSAYNTYINNLISPDNSTNPKRLYSYIKNQRKDQSGIQQLQDKDGFIRSDSLTKANILNQHFQSVFTQNEDISTIPDKGISPHPLMQHITITPTGIHKLLCTLKEHKATGPDHIPTKLLKTLADELTPIFTLFFQASLKQGTIPIDWTTANVVPIFKKGDRLQPINYRPISLTSITCKMLEHIITSNIMQHLDSHNILHDAQHGFRKHRSTETQLIQLIDNLAHNIDNRIQTDAILLDFQKAFDKVPHHRLLYKLKYYGISPQALNWVHSFLTNRTQQVLLEGNMSSSINVTSGVPQGSVLGPLLFLIYINDLPDYIQNNSTVKLFADDTIIYHPINNQQDSIALQEDLDSLQRWESDWLMHFHPQKCQTMHITNKRNIIQSTYTIHNHKLQTTNTAKYLGIHIHSTLNWNTHINKTAQRANTTSAFLHRNIRTCPRKTKHLAYTTLVRPILEYASIIWDPHTASNINKLETVQRRSARHIMHNYSRHASVTTMLQHLDLPTLQQRRQHSKIIMLYRITHKLASIPTATYIAPSTRNTQHYILPYARTHVFKTSFFPSTIKIWNNLQPVITNSTTIPQLRQALQSTPTSGRRGAPCSAGSEWTPHAY